MNYVSAKPINEARPAQIRFDPMRLGLRILRLTGDIAAYLDRNTFTCCALIVLAYLPLALLMARAIPLSSDEIYTFHIAQQPTISGVLHLSQKIDLHPPLHFLLQREALKLALPRWLASRLPSLIAGQVGLLLVFAIVARRFGNLMGVMAASVYWLSPATDFAWSNRPYALWLCLLLLTIMLWMRAAEWERSWWAPLGLGVASVLLVMDYMFGLACMLPILIAEAMRSQRRRKIDWPVVSALFIPCLAGITYVEQIKSFHTNTFSPFYLPSVSMGLQIGGGLICLPLLTLVACWLATKALPETAEAYEWPAMSWMTEEWALIVGITAMPVLLLTAAAVRHTQFFPRYAACGAVGIALLLPVLMVRYCRKIELLCVLMLCGMIIASFVRESGDTFNINGPWRAAIATGVPPQHLETLDSSLPIVVASATEFTEMSDREPLPIAHRLFYLTDRSAAQKYSGQTVFETETQTVPLLGLPSHAEPLQQFLNTHSQFYVVGNYVNQEQWVIRYLMAHGANLQYKGKYISNTSSDDLYQVTGAAPKTISSLSLPTPRY